MAKNIPKGHPRFLSLTIREKLVDGLKKGIVVPHGLLAHGRGEAFDYLLGERTINSALHAEKVACSLLLLSNNPVISVNGNVAALCCKEIVELSTIVNAKLEVNLYHRSKKRSRIIGDMLSKNGAKGVLGIQTDPQFIIDGISSNRKFADDRGIGCADTVLLGLEDGDRAGALINSGKKVISIDLNPLSRTSQSSTISIVDNLVRVIPNMIRLAKDLSNWEKPELLRLVSEFDNKLNLLHTTNFIRYGVGSSECSILPTKVI